MWSYLFKEKGGGSADPKQQYICNQLWDRQGQRAVNEQGRKWPKAGPWDHTLLYQTFSLIWKEISHLLVQFYKLLPPMYPFQRQHDLCLFWMILYIKCEMVSLNLILFHLLSISNWLKKKKHPGHGLNLDVYAWWNIQYASSWSSSPPRPRSQNTAVHPSIFSKYLIEKKLLPKHTTTDFPLISP